MDLVFVCLLRMMRSKVGTDEENLYSDSPTLEETRCYQLLRHRGGDNFAAYPSSHPIFGNFLEVSTGGKKTPDARPTNQCVIHNILLSNATFCDDSNLPGSTRWGTAFRVTSP